MRRHARAQIGWWLLLTGALGCSVEGSRQSGDDCLADRECVSPLRCVLGPAGISRCTAPVVLDVPRVDVTAAVDVVDVAVVADVVDAAQPPLDAVDVVQPTPDVVDVVRPDIVDVPDVPRADVVDVPDVPDVPDAPDASKDVVDAEG